MKLLYIRNQLLEILSDIKKQPYAYELTCSQCHIKEAINMINVRIETDEAIQRVLARSSEGETANA